MTIKVLSFNRQLLSGQSLGKSFVAEGIPESVPKEQFSWTIGSTVSVYRVFSKLSRDTPNNNKKNAPEQYGIVYTGWGVKLIVYHYYAIRMWLSFMLYNTYVQK